MPTSPAIVWGSRSPGVISRPAPAPPSRPTPARAPAPAPAPAPVAPAHRGLRLRAFVCDAKTKRRRRFEPDFIGWAGENGKTGRSGKIPKERRITSRSFRRIERMHLYASNTLFVPSPPPPTRDETLRTKSHLSEGETRRAKVERHDQLPSQLIKRPVLRQLDRPRARLRLRQRMRRQVVRQRETKLAPVKTRRPKS